MKKEDHPDSRFYLDLDLRNNKILRIACGNRHILFKEELDSYDHHRVYISKGQYNKLQQHIAKTNNSTL